MPENKINQTMALKLSGKSAPEILEMARSLIKAYSEIGANIETARGAVLAALLTVAGQIVADGLEAEIGPLSPEDNLSIALNLGITAERCEVFVLAKHKLTNTHKQN